MIAPDDVAELADIDKLLELHSVHKDRRDVERDGLSAFAKIAWPHIDSAELRWNWHHDLICDRLEKASTGEIRDLCIMIPPGTTKTLLVSVLWSAWDWIKNPGRKIIAASYGDISLDAARLHRDLISSAWYQARWPNVSIPHQNARAAGLFKNTAGGFRFSTSVGGPMTGRHGALLLGDDMSKAQDAMGGSVETMAALDASWRTWDHVMVTRRTDPATTVRVLTGQRLHEKDVPGRWTDKYPGVHVLCLPMRYNPNHPHVCEDDPRKEPGELLWPEHYPEEVVAELEEALGPIHTAAQLGQLPTPEGGAVFQSSWFRYMKRIPKGWSRQLQSWDFNVDETPGGSYVVGEVWTTDGVDALKLDQVRRRMDFYDSVGSVVDLVLKWPMSGREIVIEAKANGPAIVSYLERSYREICKKRGITDPPVVHFKLMQPKGSKLARANGVSGVCSGGHVYLLEGAPWIAEYLRELVLFTGRKGGTDDQVDTTTQALTYLFGSAQSRWADAMERARKNMRAA